jgi:hypothetical protein
MIRSVEETPLNDYRQTVKLIFEKSKEYTGDIKPYFSTMSPIQFFDYVANLPYKNDPETRIVNGEVIEGMELVHRPSIILDPKWTGSRDCDDKTNAIATYLRKNGYTFRIHVTGKGNEPRHIFLSAKFLGIWVPMDATYPGNKFGKFPYTPVYHRIFYEK